MRIEVYPFAIPNVRGCNRNYLHYHFESKVGSRRLDLLKNYKKIFYNEKETLTVTSPSENFAILPLRSTLPKVKIQLDNPIFYQKWYSKGILTALNAKVVPKNFIGIPFKMWIWQCTAKQ